MQKMRAQEQKFNKVVDVWKQASKELNFDLEAPYKLEDSDNSYQCIAMVPHFGNPKGIVILLTFPPDFPTDSKVFSVAEKLGFSCSYINVEDYMEYTKAIIVEALSDWGFFGEISNKPDFVKIK